MKKSSVYTKGGDKGETSLVSGARVPKSDIQINLYGEVDTLNSHIGYFLSLLKKDGLEDDRITSLSSKIQHNLFNLGSLLACEAENWEKFKLPTVAEDIVELMEAQIDAFDSELPTLKNFVLPGGSPAGSYSHVVRTSCRQVERLLINFQREGNEIPHLSIEFLNRLSDYFFVMGRFVSNKLGFEEVLWKKD